MDKKTLEVWKSDRPFFTSGHLKIIACLTMFVSHLAQSNLLYSLGYIKFADFSMLIGRVAMPLFCFMLVQGAIHTRNRKSYLIRLFIFALLSEIPFDLVFSGQILGFENQFDKQNVIITLFLGASLIIFWEYLNEKLENLLIKIGLMIISYWLIEDIALSIRCDYSFFGIRAIALLYLARNNKYLTALAIFLGFYFEAHVSGFELYIPYIVYLSIPFIFLYNGKRGKYPKYGFYLFYPGHLLLIYLLKLVLL